MRRSVDLPHPEGPTRTRNSPYSISSETSSTATTSPREDLRHVLEDDLGHEVDLYRTTPESAMALTTFEPVGYSRRTVATAGPQRR